MGLKFDEDDSVDDEYLDDYDCAESDEEDERLLMARRRA
jgi:hypothetical protein